MNKAIKRTLAALLAILMLLGAGTAASAAPAKSPQMSGSATGAVTQADADPAGTMTIKAQPTKTTFKLYEERPDLAGMVITVQGGEFASAKDIAYDAVTDLTPAKDRILWYFDLEPADWDSWWVEGENDAVLYVYAYKCTNFTQVEKVDGVWYGTFDQELVFYGSAAIKVTAIGRERGDERILTLDPPATVSVGEVSVDARFKFTALQDGYYKFFSEGGKCGGILYSEDGDIIERKTIDPRAELYDKDYNWLGYDDDRGGDYNFAIYQQLKAGDAVYLNVYGWASEPADFTVAVTRLGAERPELKLKNTEIKADYHGYIDVEALLEGTGLTIDDVRLECDYEYFSSWWWYNPFAAKRGTGNIVIEGPNGEIGTVKVKIDYSLTQWLCVIFLGGWAWMEYTSPGPFNLGNEIRNLFDYGVGNSLNVLFEDWYWALYSWFYSWF